MSEPQERGAAWTDERGAPATSEDARQCLQAPWQRAGPAGSQLVRQCPDCADERLFARVHDVAGSCPDSPDGDCPEWYCTDCGAAMLTGFPPQLDGLLPSLAELALAELAGGLAELVGKVA